MALIYEARHFILKTLDQLHVRAATAVIVPDPKVAVEDRTGSRPNRRSNW
jgi:hypothetical protein